MSNNIPNMMRMGKLVTERTDQAPQKGVGFPNFRAGDQMTRPG